MPILPAYDIAVHLATEVGVRPAGTASERRAQRYVADRFRSAGLRVVRDGFAVPGRGTRSRNVIATYPGTGDCLAIVMAHIDTVAGSPGGADNATGVGVVAGLAPRLARLRPKCDVWLVATGAEERVYTGSPDHLGALDLVRRVNALGRRRDLRLAISVDMLGTEPSYWLRAPRARPGRGAQRVLGAAGDLGLPVRWQPDSGTGNSDHREFVMAGLPAVLLSAATDFVPCHHDACDAGQRIRLPVQRGAQRLVERALRALR